MLFYHGWRLRLLTKTILRILWRVEFAWDFVWTGIRITQKRPPTSTSNPAWLWLCWRALVPSASSMSVGTEHGALCRSFAQIKVLLQALVETTGEISSFRSSSATSWDFCWCTFWPRVFCLYSSISTKMSWGRRRYSSSTFTTWPSSMSSSSSLGLYGSSAEA